MVAIISKRIGALALLWQWLLFLMSDDATMARAAVCGGGGGGGRDEKNSRLTTIWPVRRPTGAAEAKTST